MKTLIVILSLTFLVHSTENLKVVAIDTTNCNLTIQIKNTEMFGEILFYSGATLLSVDSKFWYITSKNGPTILYPINRYICATVDIKEN
jgi:hypothetical protein